MSGKLANKISLKVVWGDLEGRKYLRRQTFTKYLRVTLVFIGNIALGEKFNFYF